MNTQKNNSTQSHANNKARGGAIFQAMHPKGVGSLLYMLIDSSAHT